MKLVRGLLFLCLFSIFIFGISSAMAGVKVVDMLGREVMVPQEVNRVVCSGPGCLRLIVYMNLEKRVVGVEQAEKRWGPKGRPYALAHPELLKLPDIGPGGPAAIGSGPEPELVVKLHPDVIFATYMNRQRADEYQKKVHIPVVVLSYGKLATFYSKPVFESLGIIGKVMNSEERARKVRSFINGIIGELGEHTKGVKQSNKPTVYVGGIGYRGIHGINSTLCGYPPFEAVSARNVVDSLGKRGMHFFIDKEQLLQWNPDIIFIDEGGYQLCMKDLRSPIFANLRAVKGGRIYGLLPFNFYTTNIGTALSDAYYVGKILYPERFKDIAPEKRADEIYSFLVGRAVYKEMKRDFGGFRKIAVK